MKLMWWNTGRNARPPTKGYPSDAGFDLTVSEETWIEVGRMEMIPCDIGVASDANHWFLILGRSSTLWSKGLLVPPAVIDAGFRGPLFVGAYNIGSLDVQVTVGERIGQLIPMFTVPLDVHQIEIGVIPPSDRGTSGFGSTGV